jgi:hypothetical protein
MVATYTRQARTWGELALGTLEQLDELLPEVATAAADADAARRLAIDWPSESSDCWTRTSDPAVNSRLLYQLS